MGKTFKHIALKSDSDDMLSKMPRGLRSSIVSYLHMADRYFDRLLKRPEEDVVMRQRRELVQEHIGQILAHTAHAFEISETDLLSRNGSKASLESRRMLVAWLYFFGGFVYTDIPKVFGWGDHSTFIRAIDAHNENIRISEKYKKRYEDLCKALNGRVNIKEPVRPSPKTKTH